MIEHQSGDSMIGLERQLAMIRRTRRRRLCGPAAGSPAHTAPADPRRLFFEDLARWTSTRRLGRT
jgi:hypothetical protein